MSFARPDTNLAHAVRPFAWIAAVAFLTGFLISLAAGLGQMAGAHDAGSILRPTSITAPQDAGWNVRKPI